MSIDKHIAYQKTTFCDETPKGGFYTFMNVRDLILSTTKRYAEPAWKCRTVGILRSMNGHFYINDIDTESNPDCPKLLTSMVYLKEPVPSCGMPNCVQIYGEMQWVQKPVLFARILQILNPDTAINLQKTLSVIATKYLAEPRIEEPIEETCCYLK